MECRNYTVLEDKNDGTRLVQGTIYAESFPATLPTNGKDIVGLSESDTLGVGMALFTPNGTKVLFQTGWLDV